MRMKDRVEELARRRAQKRAMGGSERAERQRKRGKLDVRARLAILFDRGSFQEFGMLAASEGKLADEESPDQPTPADGVITGIGEIEGRPVAVAAYDFTVLGGSIGEVGERKVARLRDLALKNRIPIVWLVDSAGARLDASSEIDPRRIASFADTGYLFREQVVMSGVVPQVAPMVRGTSSMAIGGPNLVESVVGEKVSEEELGGSKVHTQLSGTADAEYPDDAACIAGIREYLSFFPSHCEEKPPFRTTDDPTDRRDAQLLSVVPENPRRAFDMHKVILPILDQRHFFPLKPNFARNLITGLGRIGGYPIGVVANNSIFLGGVLDVNASDKAARFINLCDAFGIPLLFLQDVPGFIVGTQVEQQGIIRHGAKMLYAVASATVPKFTVVVRKGYGAGYYVMNGRAYEPDLLVAWPGAEIGIMGPDGLVAIAARKILQSAGDANAQQVKKGELVKALR